MYFHMTGKNEFTQNEKQFVHSKANLLITFLEKKWNAVSLETMFPFITFFIFLMAKPRTDCKTLTGVA